MTFLLLLAPLAWADTAERVTRLLEKPDLEKAREVCAKDGAEAPEPCAQAERRWLDGADPDVKDLPAWEAVWTRYPGTPTAEAAREHVAAVLIGRAPAAEWPALVKTWAGTKAATERVVKSWTEAKEAPGPRALYDFVATWPDAPQRAEALELAHTRAWQAAEAADSVAGWKALLEQTPPHPATAEIKKRLAAAARRDLVAAVKVEWRGSPAATVPPDGSVPVLGAGTIAVSAPPDAKVELFVDEGGKLSPPTVVPQALGAAGVPTALLPAVPTWTEGAVRSVTLPGSWCATAAGGATVVRVSRGETVLDHRLAPNLLCAAAAVDTKPEGGVTLKGKLLKFGISVGQAKSALAGLEGPGAPDYAFTVLLGQNPSVDWSMLRGNFDGVDSASFLFYKDMLVAVDVGCGSYDSCYDEKSIYNAVRTKLPVSVFTMRADAGTVVHWGEQGHLRTLDSQYVGPESGDPSFGVLVWESKLLELAGRPNPTRPDKRSFVPVTATPAQVQGFTLELRNLVLAKNWRALAEQMSWPVVVNGYGLGDKDAFVEMVPDLGEGGKLGDTFVQTDLRTYKTAAEVQLSTAPSGATRAALTHGNGCSTAFDLVTEGGKLKVVAITVQTWE